MTTPILSVTFKDKKTTQDFARKIAERCAQQYPPMKFTVSHGMLQSYVEACSDKLPREKRLAYKKFADAVLHELAAEQARKGLPK
jgi:hypothetical protein